MTDEQLAAMHRSLAEYHRKLATEAVLDVVQHYHSDLAQRLSDEAMCMLPPDWEPPRGALSGS
jgi:hypothetical protein